MSESKETEIMKKEKRKLDCLTEKKDKDVNKNKKRIEFENDEEFEKCLLNTFKKKDESEYVLSDIVKKLVGEIKKYKSVHDMANEIKKLAINSISNNLEIICNNECTSPFFIEKYRVKYINEQNLLNIRSAQNYFKEFMVLYKNNDFEDFDLELNTNLGVEENVMVEETDEKDIDKGIEEKKDKIEKEKIKADISFLISENMYSSNSWKEKIKFRIQNINDNNVLLKILKYLHSTTIRFESISPKLKKFDIVKTLEDLDLSILNINIWDVYISKPNRSIEFFRKAILYLQNNNHTAKLISLMRHIENRMKWGTYTMENASKNNDSLNKIKENAIETIKSWKLGEVKPNNSNNLEIRLCPPICSHIDIIKSDYERAKQIVKKLDKLCNINKHLLNECGEEKNDEDIEGIKGDNAKKRKIKEKEECELLNANEEKEKTDIEDNHGIEEESYMVELVEANTKIDIRKKLDILILYMRFVHTFCFYSAKKFNTYDEMVRECGHFFFRVNLNKNISQNLIPTFYEMFNTSKLMCDDKEDIHSDRNTFITFLKPEERTMATEANGTLHLNNSTMEENSISRYQLKWRQNFEKEFSDALEMKYYENIEIEKTEEFLKVLKKSYILSTNHEKEIRCAKCKKLFASIIDVPNHIFMKHIQAKIQLITETEIEIMKTKFFESPLSFHFLHMMEKKYNSISQQNHFNKGINQKRNKNIHFVGNHVKGDVKIEGVFDGKNYGGSMNVESAPFSGKDKLNVTKKNDFYDDT